MPTTLMLSDAERQLLLELLRTEQGDLHTEIRHSMTGSVREELRERLHMVEQLIDRLQQVAVQ